MSIHIVVLPLFILASALTAPVPPPLVGHWTFDSIPQTDRPKVTDHSDSGYHGTLTGDATTGEGVHGKSLLIPGSGAVELQATKLLDNWNSVTIAAWVKPVPQGKEQTSRWPTLFEKSTGPGNKVPHILWFGLSAKSKAWCMQFGTNKKKNQFIALSGKPPMNEWSHVALVVDLPKREARLFMNGKLSFTRKIVAKGKGFWPNPQAPTTLGRLHGPKPNQWHGFMDDVRIYAGILPPTVIAELADHSP